MAKKIIFFILGGLFLLYSAYLIFIYDLSMNTGILIYLILGILLIVLGIGKVCKKNFRLLRLFNYRFAIFLKIIILAIGISFMIIISLIIFSSHSYSKEKTDYLLVLGSSVKNEKIGPSLKARLDKAIDFYKNDPSVMIIVSGGVDLSEIHSEAEIMEGYLVNNGIPHNSIIKEDRATSTMENLMYSKKIMSSCTNLDYKVTIITSDFHVFRAKILAKRNKLNFYFIASESPPILFPNNILREYFAIIKSLLFDK